MDTQNFLPTNPDLHHRLLKPVNYNCEFPG